MVVRRAWARRFRRLYGFGVAIGGKSIRIAITYHYSLSFGGSERVLEALAEMYPEADFFALFVDPAFLPEALRGRKITTSFWTGFREGSAFIASCSLCIPWLSRALIFPDTIW